MNTVSFSYIYIYFLNSPAHCYLNIAFSLFICRLLSSRHPIMDLVMYQTPPQGDSHTVALIIGPQTIIPEDPFLIGKLVERTGSNPTKGSSNKKGTGTQLPILLNHMVVLQVIVIEDQGLQSPRLKILPKRTLKQVLAQMVDHLLLGLFLLIYTTGQISLQITRMQSFSSSSLLVKTMFIKVLNTTFGPARLLETEN